MYALPFSSVLIRLPGQTLRHFLHDLLDSSADEYSLLNGVELVKNKVKEFVIMGLTFLVLLYFR